MNLFLLPFKAHTNVLTRVTWRLIKSFQSGDFFCILLFFNITTDVLFLEASRQMIIHKYTRDIEVVKVYMNTKIQAI